MYSRATVLMLRLMLLLEYGSCYCSIHLLSNMLQKLCYKICSYTVDEDLCAPEAMASCQRAQAYLYQ
jgi:hypothetical protein